jgi:hypothetical protein
VRRLPRILLNALTALSLILFVATVALWVGSYWVAYDVAFVGRHWCLAGANAREGLAVNWESGRQQPFEEGRFIYVDHPPMRMSDIFGTASPAWPIAAWRDTINSNRVTVVGVPYWLASTVFGLPPAIWVVRRVR